MPKSKATNRVIVRTYSAGVHYGTLVSRKGREVVLADAKRIWRWFGANTLHEVSLHGVAATSKISDPVKSIILTEAIEVIACAPEAAANLDGAKWSK
jgi:hypothetical protein